MRLLVVDDEFELRRILGQALRESGYAVDEAADGAEAIGKISAYEYDGVVLDVMIPKFDGWEVLKRIRTKTKTPVLMLTARDTVDDRVKGLDSGADDYLVKPFALAELLARVRSMIRRAADQPMPVIAIGGVTVDTAAMRVAIDGRDVVLTGREYAIVELLVRNRGRVVTRMRMLEHIFDETDDSLSNLIEVHISNIRKKLGRDFIETRRGLGYTIDG